LTGYGVRGTGFELQVTSYGMRVLTLVSLGQDELRGVAGCSR
jgi:hypothetical protein